MTRPDNPDSSDPVADLLRLKRYETPDPIRQEALFQRIHAEVAASAPNPVAAWLALPGLRYGALAAALAAAFFLMPRVDPGTETARPPASPPADGSSDLAILSLSEDSPPPADWAAPAPGGVDWSIADDSSFPTFEEFLRQNPSRPALSLPGAVAPVGLTTEWLDPAPRSVGQGTSDSFPDILAPALQPGSASLLDP